jgi:hypothetical protein
MLTLIEGGLPNPPHAQHDMSSVGQKLPTSAVGRVSLYRCCEWMKSEQVDRSTLVILAIETFETLRAHNPL